MSGTSQEIEFTTLVTSYIPVAGTNPGDPVTGDVQITSAASFTGDSGETAVIWDSGLTVWADYTTDQENYLIVSKNNFNIQVYNSANSKSGYFDMFDDVARIAAASGSHLGEPNGIDGILIFDNATNTNTIGIKTGVTTTSYNITLPVKLNKGGYLLTDPTGVSEFNNSIAAYGAVNVRDYGAIGDGVTNDRPAFQAAIATGKNVFVPPDGTFLITGAGSGNIQLSLSDNQSIFGVMNSSVIKMQANTRAISPGNNSIISGLSFIGSGMSSGNTFEAGIICYDKINWLITQCTFTGIAGASGLNAGAGIYVISLQGAGTNWQDGGKIYGCHFESNGCGINFANKGEYVTVASCTVNFNTTGVSIGAGNVTFDGCNIIKNTVGVDIYSGANTGHGVFSACNINHNSSYNIQIADNPFGHTFSGCHIYEGSIIITNSSGISFIGCEIDVANYYFDGSLSTVFRACTFDTSYGNVFHYDYNGHNSETSFKNCEYLNTTPFHLVTSSASTMTMDIKVDTYIFNGTTATYTSTRTGSSKEKQFAIVNLGSGNLTYNSYTGGSTFINMNAGGTTASSITIPSMYQAFVVDNGTNQVVIYQPALSFTPLGGSIGNTQIAYGTSTGTIQSNQDFYLKSSGNVAVLGNRAQNNQPTFWEFVKGNGSGSLQSLRAGIGFYGTTEVNMCINMDYNTGVHKYYDATLPASWIYNGYSNGVGQQYVPANNPNTGDIFNVYGCVPWKFELYNQPATGKGIDGFSKMTTARIELANSVDTSTVANDKTTFENVNSVLTVKIGTTALMTFAFASGLTLNQQNATITLDRSGNTGANSNFLVYKSNGTYLSVTGHQRSDNTGIFASGVTANSYCINSQGNDIYFGSTATPQIAMKSSGVSIGTAATDKVGLFGVTPVVKPTTSVTPATYTSVGGSPVNTNDTFGGYTIAQIVQAMKNLGMLT